MIVSKRMFIFFNGTAFHCSSLFLPSISMPSKKCMDLSHSITTADENTMLKKPKLPTEMPRGIWYLDTASLLRAGNVTRGRDGRRVTREARKRGVFSRARRVREDGLDIPWGVGLHLSFVLVSLGHRRHWINLISLHGKRDWKNENKNKMF